jgi:hypothetical protein
MTPLFGSNVVSYQLNGGNVDWMGSPDKLIARPQRPYPLGNPVSLNGVLSPTQKFTKLSPWGQPGQLYTKTPGWVKRDGVVVQTQDSPEFGTAQIDAIRDQFIKQGICGGPVGVAQVNTYIVSRSHPSGGKGPLFLGVDPIGGIWYKNRDGTLTAAAGYVPINDYQIPNADMSGYRHWVGTFPDGFPQFTTDLILDRVNRKIFYVVDRGLKCLWRVDRTAGNSVPGQWVWTKFVTGFTKPISGDMLTDGRMYVVDQDAIMLINRDTGALTKFMDFSKGFCIRRTSDNQLNLATQATNILRINPNTKAMTVLFVHPAHDWPWFGVDVGGHMGPKDAIYFVHATGGNGNNDFYRIKQDGTNDGPQTFQSSGRATQGLVTDCFEPSGHYNWMAEPHEEEPFIDLGGYGNTNNWLIRPAIVTDLQDNNDLAAVALGIMHYGTADGFPARCRPSFTALRNPYGHSRLGVASFDEIAEMDDATFDAYVQNGFGGSVKRPELSGIHLRALRYWTDRQSTQFMEGRAPRVRPLPADKAPPVITNIVAVKTDSRVVVTWRTDKPSFGYVAFGRTALYNRWKLESGTYATQHTVELEHCDYPQLNFSVRAQSVAGYLATSANQVI